MARMDWVTCFYVSRRSVRCSQMNLEALLLNALSYSYFTASNLRTLLTEQETAYGDVDLLCHLLRLFSVDSPR